MAATTSAQMILFQSVTAGASAEIPSEFWGLVERHRAELANQALALLGSLEDAEDVVQETFCEVYRDRKRLMSMQSLGGWLRSVNRANALNRLRKRRRDGQKLALKKQRAPEPEAVTGGFRLLEMREAVAKAIETLPAELRSVVVLRYWENRSYSEIAGALGIPQGTVWRRLCDASILLAGILRPDPSARVKTEEVP